MFSIRSWARSGVIAVAALATAPAAAPAAAIAPAVPAVAGTTLPLTLAQGEGRDNSASGAYRRWPRYQSGPRMGNREFRQHRGEFRRDDRRSYRRHHRDRYWGGPGIILNFSAPAYRYRAPRTRYANSHVEWCYARYRSYRAWDNTYQPNHGRRRQCISPYS